MNTGDHMDLGKYSVVSFTPDVPGHTVTVKWDDGPSTYDVIGWAIVVTLAAEGGQPAVTELEPVFIVEVHGLTYPTLLQFQADGPPLEITLAGPA